MIGPWISSTVREGGALSPSPRLRRGGQGWGGPGESFPFATRASADPARLPPSIRTFQPPPTATLPAASGERERTAQPRGKPSDAAGGKAFLPQSPPPDGTLPAPERVVIYTDGACSGNPGPGGWGAILVFKGQERELSGGEPDTTNNRMELTAAIEGLAALKRSCSVDVFTDSQYVRQGITAWMRNWKARGWRTADNKPVKNEDLWRRLDAEAARHAVRWHWVKGHASDALNNRVDALAVAALRPFKKRG